MSDLAPTARELDALKVLWKNGQATVREIYDDLKPAVGDLAYTTVLSLMQTMEQKGLVSRQSVGKAHVYTARVAREKTCRQLVGTFLDRVFDGAMGEYLCRALETHPPSKAELDELERMIAEARRRMERPPTREDHA
jgi:predicted transcriptional regulator